MIKRKKKLLIILLMIASIFIICTKVTYADSGFDASYDGGGSSYDYGTNKTTQPDGLEQIEEGTNEILENAEERQIYDNNTQTVNYTYYNQNKNEVAELTNKVNENTRIMIYLIIAIIAILIIFSILLITLIIILKNNKKGK